MLCVPVGGIGDATSLRQYFVICPPTRVVLPNVFMQTTSPCTFSVTPAVLASCSSYCPFAANGVAGSVLSATNEYFSLAMPKAGTPVGKPTWPDARLPLAACAEAAICGRRGVVGGRGRRSNGPSGVNPTRSSAGASLRLGPPSGAVSVRLVTGSAHAASVAQRTTRLGRADFDM